MSADTLPVPLLNVLNGGAHADNPLEIQEFMIIPHGADDFRTSLDWGVEVYQALKSILKSKGFLTAVGDEGGFAPDLRSTREALDLLLEAIQQTGLAPWRDVALALDVAANEILKGNLYSLEGTLRSSEEMVTFYADLCRTYPIVSIEDGLGEEDWDGWRLLTETLGDKIQLVGDDLFVTNPKRILRGEGAANAVLIKPNQIGTISEVLQAVQLTHQQGWRCVGSHRSGETEDVSLAHIAVGFGLSQIKAGAPARTERLAKYNELLRIEEQLGTAAKFRKGLFDGVGKV